MIPRSPIVNLDAAPDVFAAQLEAAAEADAVLFVTPWVQAQVALEVEIDEIRRRPDGPVCGRDPFVDAP